MWLEPERAHPAADCARSVACACCAPWRTWAVVNFRISIRFCFPGGSQSTMRLVLADLDATP